MQSNKIKLVIVWHGAVVPSYQYFFDELQKRAEVFVVSPTKWKHGSKTFTQEHSHKSYDEISTNYFFEGSSHYFIPGLFSIIFKIKPTHLYFMDELDRFTTFAHLLPIKLFFPKLTLITYSLQNIFNPSYYKIWHRLFKKINSKLTNGTIASTEDSKKVIQNLIQDKSIPIIPLGVSTKFFFPGNKSDMRKKYGLPMDKTLIIHAGSIHTGKGIDLLFKAFPIDRKDLFLILIGNKTDPDLNFPKRGDWFLKLPAIPSERLRDYYQASDYVFLGSKSLPFWTEQIGRSLLEGVLCGCVAIGSTSGNIPNITIRNEGSFQQNSIQDLKKLLGTLPLNNHEEVYHDQYENVLENYEWANIAKKSVHYFESLKC